MTPFDHLLAATEQRVATAKAAVFANRPDDVRDLGTLVGDLCRSAVESRDPAAFDRMIGLLGRVGELEAAIQLKLKGTSAEAKPPTAPSAGLKSFDDHPASAHAGRRSDTAGLTA